MKHPLQRVSKKHSFSELMTADSEGVLCGSTYLNQRLRNLLKDRLKDEHYLRDIEDTLDQTTRTFDLDLKKVFDGTEGEYFFVPGLLEDPSRGFQEGRLMITA
jgi:hypothetical protein